MQIKKILDETFGPPGEALKTIRGVSEALSTLDQPKLRLLKSTLDSVAKVKGSPQELDMVLELIRLIVSADMEKIVAVRDIVTNLVKLVRYLPKEALAALPIKEIVGEIRKGGV